MLALLGLSCEPALVELSQVRLVFGRDPECDIQLAGTEASRRHAEIARVGPLHVVRDLGSTNGTFVGGQRAGEAPLSAHSVLRMGDWLAVAAELRPDEPRLGAFGEHAPGVWGGSELRAALGPARKVAQSDLPVIIEGETGTGKELVARAIHEWSGRSGPFVALNCAALPEALVEGELFGYRRGAFTGAERASLGLFRSAEGGTLLLDEVCELPPATQVKLLRVLEQREVVPLGESRPVPIDVRVVSAAQEPLHRVVAQSRFRADLYARLDGLTVVLPPLRQRLADIPRLLARFMREEGRDRAPEFSVNALEALCLYDWPFNVRELRLLGRRLAVLHGDADAIHRRHLPERMRVRRASAAPAATPEDERHHELDRLLAALREHRGNVSRAAVDAGISRNRAYRLMNANPEFDLDAFRRDGEAAES